MIDQRHLHERYTLQAQWTRPLREYLYKYFVTEEALSVLEIGCGTGALLESVQDEYKGNIKIIAGIDIDTDVLKYAKNNIGNNILQCNGERLPFMNKSFDFVFCHYLLMWVPDPVVILKEMKRVAKKGGICSAIAEPCYSEIEAKPSELSKLSCLQVEKFRKDGADTDAGVKLYDYFLQSGFSNIKFNKYITEKQNPDHIVKELEQLKLDCEIDELDIEINETTVYNVPTYYAYAIN